MSFWWLQNHNLSNKTISSIVSYGEEMKIWYAEQNQCVDQYYQYYHLTEKLSNRVLKM